MQDGCAAASFPVGMTSPTRRCEAMAQSEADEGAPTRRWVAAHLGKPPCLICMLPAAVSDEGRRCRS